MPLYEYECDAGHRFEVIQKFSDPLVDKCPTCGAPVHKLMSSPAIQFKGSGWYITDYAKKDQGGQAAAKTDDGGTASAKDQSAKTDAAAKSDDTSAKSSSSTAPATSTSSTTTDKK